MSIEAEVETLFKNKILKAMVGIKSKELTVEGRILGMEEME